MEQPLTQRHDFRQDNGKVILEYPDWVNVISVTEDGLLVMEKHYRHGLGKTCYDIPAGVIEDGENPLDAAKRELIEETGYGEGIWRELMSLTGNASTTNNLSTATLPLVSRR